MQHIYKDSHHRGNGRFTPSEKPPVIHCTGGWLSPTAGLDAVVRERNPCPESNPGYPACSIVTMLIERTMYVQ